MSELPNTYDLLRRLRARTVSDRIPGSPLMSQQVPDRDCQDAATAIMWLEQALTVERADIARLIQSETEISAAIGCNDYLDPPDGGDVSLAEQVRRMKADLVSQRVRAEKAERERDEAQEWADKHHARNIEAERERDAAESRHAALLAEAAKALEVIEKFRTAKGSAAADHWDGVNEFARDLFEEVDAEARWVSASLRQAIEGA